MSSARYYKKQRKIAKRKARERYQNLPEEENVKKADNIGMKDIKIFLKVKSWFIVRRIILKCGKSFCDNQNISLSSLLLSAA